MEYSKNLEGAITNLLFLNHPAKSFETPQTSTSKPSGLLLAGGLILCVGSVWIIKKLLNWKNFISKMRTGIHVKRKGSASPPSGITSWLLQLGKTVSSKFRWCSGNSQNMTVGFDSPFKRFSPAIRCRSLPTSRAAAEAYLRGELSAATTRSKRERILQSYRLYLGRNLEGKTKSEILSPSEFEKKYKKKMFSPGPVDHQHLRAEGSSHGVKHVAPVVVQDSDITCESFHSVQTFHGPKSLFPPKVKPVEKEKLSTVAQPTQKSVSSKPDQLHLLPPRSISRHKDSAPSNEQGPMRSKFSRSKPPIDRQHNVSQWPQRPSSTAVSSVTTADILLRVSPSQTKNRKRVLAKYLNILHIADSQETANKELSHQPPIIDGKIEITDQTVKILRQPVSLRSVSRSSASTPTDATTERGQCSTSGTKSLLSHSSYDDEEGDKIEAIKKYTALQSSQQRTFFQEVAVSPMISASRQARRAAPKCAEGQKKATQRKSPLRIVKPAIRDLRYSPRRGGLLNNAKGTRVGTHNPMMLKGQKKVNTPSAINTSNISKKKDPILSKKETDYTVERGSQKDVRLLANSSIHSSIHESIHMVESLMSVKEQQPLRKNTDKKSEIISRSVSSSPNNQVKQHMGHDSAASPERTRDLRSSLKITSHDDIPTTSAVVLTLPGESMPAAAKNSETLEVVDAPKEPESFQKMRSDKSSVTWDLNEPSDSAKSVQTVQSKKSSKLGGKKTRSSSESPLSFEKFILESKNPIGITQLLCKSGITTTYEQLGSEEPQGPGSVRSRMSRPRSKVFPTLTSFLNHIEREDQKRREHLEHARSVEGKTAKMQKTRQFSQRTMSLSESDKTQTNSKRYSLKSETLKSQMEARISILSDTYDTPTSKKSRQSGQTHPNESKRSTEKVPHFGIANLRYYTKSNSRENVNQTAETYTQTAKQDQATSPNKPMILGRGIVRFSPLSHYPNKFKGATQKDRAAIKLVPCSKPKKPSINVVKFGVRNWKKNALKNMKKGLNEKVGRCRGKNIPKIDNSKPASFKKTITHCQKDQEKQAERLQDQSMSEVKAIQFSSEHKGPGYSAAGSPHGPQLQLKGTKTSPGKLDSIRAFASSSKDSVFTLNDLRSSTSSFTSLLAHDYTRFSPTTWLEKLWQLKEPMENVAETENLQQNEIDNSARKPTMRVRSDSKCSHSTNDTFLDTSLTEHSKLLFASKLVENYNQRARELSWGKWNRTRTEQDCLERSKSFPLRQDRSQSVHNSQLSTQRDVTPADDERYLTGQSKENQMPSFDISSDAIASNVPNMQWTSMPMTTHRTAKEELRFLLEQTKSTLAKSSSRNPDGSQLGTRKSSDTHLTERYLKQRTDDTAINKTRCRSSSAVIFSRAQPHPKYVVHTADMFSDSSVVQRQGKNRHESKPSSPAHRLEMRDSPCKSTITTTTEAKGMNQESYTSKHRAKESKNKKKVPWRGTLAFRKRLQYLMQKNQSIQNKMNSYRTQGVPRNVKYATIRTADPEIQKANMTVRLAGISKALTHTREMNCTLPNLRHPHGLKELGGTLKEMRKTDTQKWKPQIRTLKFSQPRKSNLRGELPGELSKAKYIKDTVKGKNYKRKTFFSSRNNDENKRGSARVTTVPTVLNTKCSAVKRQSPSPTHGRRTFSSQIAGADNTVFQKQKRLSSNASLPGMVDVLDGKSRKLSSSNINRTRSAPGYNTRHQSLGNHYNDTGFTPALSHSSIFTKEKLEDKTGYQTKTLYPMEGNEIPSHFIGYQSSGMSQFPLQKIQTAPTSTEAGFFPHRKGGVQERQWNTYVPTRRGAQRRDLDERQMESRYVQPPTQAPPNLHTAEVEKDLRRLSGNMKSMMFAETETFEPQLKKRQNLVQWEVGKEGRKQEFPSQIPDVSSRPKYPTGPEVRRKYLSAPSVKIDSNIKGYPCMGSAYEWQLQLSAGNTTRQTKALLKADHNDFQPKFMTKGPETEEIRPPKDVQMTQRTLEIEDYLPHNKSVETDQGMHTVRQDSPISLDSFMSKTEAKCKRVEATDSVHTKSLQFGGATELFQNQQIVKTAFYSKMVPFECDREKSGSGTLENILKKCSLDIVSEVTEPPSDINEKPTEVTLKRPGWLQETVRKSPTSEMSGQKETKKRSDARNDAKDSPGPGTGSAILKNTYSAGYIRTDKTVRRAEPAEKLLFPAKGDISHRVIQQTNIEKHEKTSTDGMPPDRFKSNSFPEKQGQKPQSHPVLPKRSPSKSPSVTDLTEKKVIRSPSRTNLLVSESKADLLLNLPFNKDTMIPAHSLLSEPIDHKYEATTRKSEDNSMKFTHKFSDDPLSHVPKNEISREGHQTKASEDTCLKRFSEMKSHQISGAPINFEERGPETFGEKNDTVIPPRNNEILSDLQPGSSRQGAVDVATKFSLISNQTSWNDHSAATNSLKGYVQSKTTAGNIEQSTVAAHDDSVWPSQSPSYCLLHPGRTGPQNLFIDARVSQVGINLSVKSLREERDSASGIQSLPKDTSRGQLRSSANIMTIKSVCSDHDKEGSYTSNGTGTAVSSKYENEVVDHRFSTPQNDNDVLATRQEIVAEDNPLEQDKTISCEGARAGNVTSTYQSKVIANLDDPVGKCDVSKSAKNVQKTTGTNKSAQVQSWPGMETNGNKKMLDAVGTPSQNAVPATSGQLSLKEVMLLVGKMLISGHDEGGIVEEITGGPWHDDKQGKKIRQEISPSSTGQHLGETEDKDFAAMEETQARRATAENPSSHEETLTKTEDSLEPRSMNSSEILQNVPLVPSRCTKSETSRTTTAPRVPAMARVAKYSAASTETESFSSETTSFSNTRQGARKGTLAKSSIPPSPLKINGSHVVLKGTIHSGRWNNKKTSRSFGGRPKKKLDTAKARVANIIKDTKTKATVSNDKPGSQSLVQLDSYGVLKTSKVSYSATEQKTLNEDPSAKKPSQLHSEKRTQTFVARKDKAKPATGVGASTCPASIIQELKTKLEMKKSALEKSTLSSTGLRSFKRNKTEDVKIKPFRHNKAILRRWQVDHHKSKKVKPDDTLEGKSTETITGSKDKLASDAAEHGALSDRLVSVKEDEKVIQTTTTKQDRNSDEQGATTQSETKDLNPTFTISSTITKDSIHKSDSSEKSKSVDDLESILNFEISEAGQTCHKQRLFTGCRDRTQRKGKRRGRKQQKQCSPVSNQIELHYQFLRENGGSSKFSSSNTSPQSIRSTNDAATSNVFTHSGQRFPATSGRFTKLEDFLLNTEKSNQIGVGHLGSKTYSKMSSLTSVTHSSEEDERLQALLESAEEKEIKRSKNESTHGAREIHLSRKPSTAKGNNTTPISQEHNTSSPNDQVNVSMLTSSGENKTSKDASAVGISKNSDAGPENSRASMPVLKLGDIHNRASPQISKEQCTSGGPNDPQDLVNLREDSNRAQKCEFDKTKANIKQDNTEINNVPQNQSPHQSDNDILHDISLNSSLKISEMTINTLRADQALEKLETSKEKDQIQDKDDATHPQTNDDVLSNSSSSIVLSWVGSDVLDPGDLGLHPPSDHNFKEECDVSARAATERLPHFLGQDHPEDTHTRDLFFDEMSADHNDSAYQVKSSLGFSKVWEDDNCSSRISNSAQNKTGNRCDSAMQGNEDDLNSPHVCSVVSGMPVNELREIVLKSLPQVSGDSNYNESMKPKRSSLPLRGSKMAHRYTQLLGSDSNRTHGIHQEWEQEVKCSSHISHDTIKRLDSPEVDGRIGCALEQQSYFDAMLRDPRWNPSVSATAHNTGQFASYDCLPNAAGNYIAYSCENTRFRSTSSSSLQNKQHLCAIYNRYHSRSATQHSAQDKQYFHTVFKDRVSQDSERAKQTVFQVDHGPGDKVTCRHGLMAKNASPEPTHSSTQLPRTKICPEEEGRPVQDRCSSREKRNIPPKNGAYDKRVKYFGNQHVPLHSTHGMLNKTASLLPTPTRAMVQKNKGMKSLEEHLQARSATDSRSLSSHLTREYQKRPTSDTGRHKSRSAISPGQHLSSRSDTNRRAAEAADTASHPDNSTGAGSTSSQASLNWYKPQSLSSSASCSNSQAAATHPEGPTLTLIPSQSEPDPLGNFTPGTLLSAQGLRKSTSAFHSSSQTQRSTAGHSRTTLNLQQPTPKQTTSLGCSRLPKIINSLRYQSEPTSRDGPKLIPTNQTSRSYERLANTRGLQHARMSPHSKTVQTGGCKHSRNKSRDFGQSLRPNTPEPNQRSGDDSRSGSNTAHNRFTITNRQPTTTGRAIPVDIVTARRTTAQRTANLQQTPGAASTTRYAAFFNHSVTDEEHRTARSVFAGRPISRLTQNPTHTFRTIPASRIFKPESNDQQQNSSPGTTPVKSSVPVSKIVEMFEKRKGT